MSEVLIQRPHLEFFMKPQSFWIGITSLWLALFMDTFSKKDNLFLTIIPRSLGAMAAVLIMALICWALFRALGFYKTPDERRASVFGGALVLTALLLLVRMLRP